MLLALLSLFQEVAVVVVPAPSGWSRDPVQLVAVDHPPHVLVATPIP